jgi:hypothetical protein
MVTTGRYTFLALCICLGAGCSSSPPGKASSSTSTVLVTAASFATILPTTTTTTTTIAGDATPTTTGTSVLTPDEAHMVADCVKFIPIGAVTADQEATDLWDIADREVNRLTALCTDLLKSPATLASLSLKLKAFELAQEAATQSSGQASGSSTTTTG